MQLVSALLLTSLLFVHHAIPGVYSFNEGSNNTTDFTQTIDDNTPIDDNLTFPDIDESATEMDQGLEILKEVRDTAWWVMNPRNKGAIGLLHLKFVCNVVDGFPFIITDARMDHLPPNKWVTMGGDAGVGIEQLRLHHGNKILITGYEGSAIVIDRNITVHIKYDGCKNAMGGDLHYANYSIEYLRRNDKSLIPSTTIVKLLDFDENMELIEAARMEKRREYNRINSVRIMRQMSGLVTLSPNTFLANACPSTIGGVTLIDTILERNKVEKLPLDWVLMMEAVPSEMRPVSQGFEKFWPSQYLAQDALDHYREQDELPWLYPGTTTEAIATLDVKFECLFFDDQKLPVAPFMVYEATVIDNPGNFWMIEYEPVLYFDQTRMILLARSKRARNTAGNITFRIRYTGCKEMMEFGNYHEMTYTYHYEPRNDSSLLPPESAINIFKQPSTVWYKAPFMEPHQRYFRRRFLAAIFYDQMNHYVYWRNQTMIHRKDCHPNYEILWKQFFYGKTHIW